MLTHLDLVFSTEMYSGVISIEVPQDVIDSLGGTGTIELTDSGLGVTTYPNQYLVLKSHPDAKATVVRRGENETVIRHVPVRSMLSSRNKEQSWALELLHDDAIKLVTLTGPAGTGKTLLALAAGKQQLFSSYSRLIVTRPIVALGKDLGFLPGTLEEKMEPWIAPIRDNLKFLTDNDRGSKGSSRKGSMQQLIEHGDIEIQAVPYIRGRTLPKAYIVVDEAQNLDIASLKAIITRAGEGSKIILTGDTDQIDSKTESGLSIVVEAFKTQRIAGHISLTKGERSALATIASRIL